MKRGIICAFFLLYSMFLPANAMVSSKADATHGGERVFRVLLVIGDQWEDPASYVVSPPGPTGKYSGYDATPDMAGPVDFHHIAMLLKSWAIPFDIVRLDQQWLNRYTFLDMHDFPKYGTIIWDVNKSEKILPQDYSIVGEMVMGYGLGFIAIADRVSQPGIQDILGIRRTGSWESNAPMEVTGSHFITEGVASPLLADSGTVAHMQRQQAVLLDGTEAIVRQGPYGQVTVRSYPNGSHAVWIGNDPSWLFSFRTESLVAE